MHIRLLIEIIEYFFKHLRRNENYCVKLFKTTMFIAAAMFESNQ